MMTYEKLETKLQTQQTQIDNLIRITEQQQSLLDQAYVIIQNMQLTMADLINSTTHTGSYIAGQIASKDGR